MVRNKDTTLYTYLMIHFYLLQSDKMKQSALSKIISSEENKFYLPDQLQFIPPEFTWFGTKSISHITEYSGQLSQENSKYMLRTFQGASWHSVGNRHNHPVLRLAKLAGAASPESRREGDHATRKSACRDSGSLC